MAELRIPVTPKDHVQGLEEAPVTLVEYGDYQCPYCGRAYPVVKRLQKHFGKSLRFVFRNFPLRQSHPYAESAAETAEFAGAHGKFWEMHDLLFENQERLGEPLYLELGKGLGLSVPALRQSLSDGQYRTRIDADFTGGVRSGVNGTPAFFINGERHDGKYDYDSLAIAIQGVTAQR